MSEKVEDGHFVGAVRANRKFGGLTLAETSYPAGLVVPAHAHESALVTLVLDGGLTEQRGHRSAMCGKGSLIFQPPDEPHGHRFSNQGGRCFVLQLGSPWIDRMRDLSLAQPQSPLDIRGTPANWLAGRIYREFGMADAAAQLTIEGLALAMLGELARAKTRAEAAAKPPWLIRAVELLHDRLRDDLSMAEIAGAVGVHPVHLSRTFKQHYGSTMGEYVRRRRVELAQRELATTDRPLAEIAYAAGFSDQSHFSRVFKELVGTTPGAYRKATAPR